MMILTLAQRELRSLFLSPLAWTILAAVQIIIAYLFLFQVNEYIILQPRLQMLDNVPGVTQIIVAQLFSSVGFILMLIIPLITMRVISEERRNRTLTLLFSAPISMSEIILGKYLGVVAFLCIMTGMLCLMPLSILFAGSLDMGLLFTIIVGLVLLLSAFSAVGVYMSTLTLQPTVAAVSSFGILLLLWLVDWAGNKVADSETSGVLSYISILRHFEALLNGVFSSSDVIYFFLFITLFIVLSIRRLDGDRLQH